MRFARISFLILFGFLSQVEGSRLPTYQALLLSFERLSGGGPVIISPTFPEYRPYGSTPPFHWHGGGTIALTQFLRKLPLGRMIKLMTPVELREDPMFRSALLSATRDSAEGVRVFADWLGDRGILSEGVIRVLPELVRAQRRINELNDITIHLGNYLPDFRPFSQDIGVTVRLNGRWWHFDRTTVVEFQTIGDVRNEISRLETEVEGPIVQEIVRWIELTTPHGLQQLD